jgi:hypothetical protein
VDVGLNGWWSMETNSTLESHYNTKLGQEMHREVRATLTSVSGLSLKGEQREDLMIK